MSRCVDISSTSNEQLCYIPCYFCNFVLAVSVPCNRLNDIVSVRCGHCSNMLAVNMAAAAPHPPSTSQAPCDTNFADNYRIDLGSSSGFNNSNTIRQHAIHTPQERTINRSPEKKKQRLPSAYNQFIKEEIQRIKANNPHIPHRKAFSTAAKNWAHFPDDMHVGLMLGNNTSQQPELDDDENAAGAGELRIPRAALQS